MTGSAPLKSLAVPGGTIAFEDAGRGRPMVLIHAGIADRRIWDREFPTLSSHYRVVRYDLRGYGGSPPATSEYSGVRDLAALLDHLNVPSTVLVGTSIGGKLALDFALAHPDRVDGLLLVAPAYSGMDYDHVPGGKATWEKDERLSKAASEAWSAGKLEEATEHLRELWTSALTGSALDLFRTMVRENAVEVFEDRSGRHETSVGAPAAGRLNEVHAPTRILVGDRDNPAMPHCADFLARGIAGASVQRIPGADHLVNLSRPEAFDGAVRDFMDRLPAPGR